MYMYMIYLCIILFHQTPKEALLSLSFPVSVAQLFSLEEQLEAIAQLLVYTTSLPLEKPQCEGGLLCVCVSVCACV